MPRKAPPGTPPVIKLNLRANAELLMQIDEARAAMLRDEEIARIPSRSEFVRLAVDAYLAARGAKGGKTVSARVRGK